MYLANRILACVLVAILVVGSACDARGSNNDPFSPTPSASAETCSDSTTVTKVTDRLLIDTEICKDCYGWVTRAWSPWTSTAKGCGQEVERRRRRVVSCENNGPSPDEPLTEDQCLAKGLMADKMPPTEQMSNVIDFSGCNKTWWRKAENLWPRAACKRDCIEHGPGKMVQRIAFECASNDSEGKRKPHDDSECDQGEKPDEEVVIPDCTCNEPADQSYQADCDHRWEEDSWSEWTPCVPDCGAKERTRTRNVRCTASNKDSTTKFTQKDTSRCGPQPETTQTKTCSDEESKKPPFEWKRTGWAEWDSGEPACGITPRFRKPTLKCQRKCEDDTTKSAFVNEANCDKTKFYEEEKSLTQNETVIGATANKSRDGEPLHNFNYQACKYYWRRTPWSKPVRVSNEPCGRNNAVRRRDVPCIRADVSDDELKKGKGTEVADGCCDWTLDTGKTRCLDRLTAAGMALRYCSWSLLVGTLLSFALIY